MLVLNSCVKKGLKKYRNMIFFVKKKRYIHRENHIFQNRMAYLFCFAISSVHDKAKEPYHKGVLNCPSIYFYIQMNDT